MKSDWKECTLAELGEIVGGATPSTKDEQNYGGDIAWITPKDLSTLKGRFISRGERNITEKGLRSCSAQIMPKNAVLFSSRAPIGYVAIAANPVCTNQGFKSIVANSDNDPMFLYYLLKYNKNAIEAMGSGTTFKEVSGSTMRGIRVYVPISKAEQQRIAAILSALDEKIAINREINDNLLAQAQALFTQRFMTDDIEGNEKPLYDFADYINGAAFKPSECGEHGLPIIKIVELKNGITDSTKYFDGFKGEKYLIQDKDILFSWSGNPDTSIDIFIWTHGSAILNQHTFNVKSNTGHRWFTFLMLKHFKPEFSRIASNKQTTGLGHVTANDLKRLTFIFNETAIETFEQEISPFMETIYSNMIEKQRLELLRDSLLPKLMSGEIDVSDIQL